MKTLKKKVVIAVAVIGALAAATAYADPSSNPFCDWLGKICKISG